MKRPSNDRAEPSDLELQVLSVLWERGPSGVRDVMEEIPDGKPRAYTTILTVLQVLEKKGLVRHVQNGRQYVYHAATNRDGVLRPRLRRLLRYVFRGDPAAVLQQILDETSVTPEDLKAMRKALAKRETELCGKRKRGPQ